MEPCLPKPVKVVIVDDHQVVLVGLRVLLGSHPDIEIVGEASSGEAGLAVIQAQRPSVVLLDLRLPDLDGLEVCRRLKASTDSPSVLVLTSYADDKTILAAINAGADGYLLKQAVGQDITSVILTVAAGGSVLDPFVTRRLLGATRGADRTRTEPTVEDRWKRLTPQETRVLELLAAGQSNKRIAQVMHLSEGTVRNHLSVVFGKLGVQSRVEAACTWLKRNPI